MIVFDLDGTLADCEHRRHFVQKPERCDSSYRDCTCKKCEETFYWNTDWKSFFEACDKDKPILPVFEVFFNLPDPKGKDIQIWSGRCESVRKKTCDWLIFESGHTLYPAWLERNLKMRPIGDNTPDDVLKEKWLDEAIADGKTIDMVFDDRKKVVSMWRRRGIFVFDCNQSGNEF